MDIRTKSQGGEPTYNVSVGKAGKGECDVRRRSSLALQWWCNLQPAFDSAVVEPHVDPVSSVHVGRSWMHLSSIYDPTVKVQWCTISLELLFLGIASHSGAQECFLCLSFDVVLEQLGAFWPLTAKAYKGYIRLRVLPVFMLSVWALVFCPPLLSIRCWIPGEPGSAVWNPTHCLLSGFPQTSLDACFLLSPWLTLPFRPTGLFCSRVLLVNLSMYWGEVPDAFCMCTTIVRGECLFSYLLLLAGACPPVNPLTKPSRQIPSGWWWDGSSSTVLHQQPCSPDCRASATSGNAY